MDIKWNVIEYLHSFRLINSQGIGGKMAWINISRRYYIRLLAKCLYTHTHNKHSVQYNTINNIITMYTRSRCTAMVPYIVLLLPPPTKSMISIRKTHWTECRRLAADSVLCTGKRVLTVAAAAVAAVAVTHIRLRIQPRKRPGIYRGTWDGVPAGGSSPADSVIRSARHPT